MEKEKKIKISFVVTAFFFLAILVRPVIAEEKVIQEEKMPFDKCLNVINISSDKLSVNPKTLDESEKKRVVVFALSDGTLKITCDGEKNLVTVSTNVR